MKSAFPRGHGWRRRNRSIRSVGGMGPPSDLGRQMMLRPSRAVLVGFAAAIAFLFRGSQLPTPVKGEATA